MLRDYGKIGKGYFINGVLFTHEDSRAKPL